MIRTNLVFAVAFAAGLFGGACGDGAPMSGDVDAGLLLGSAIEGLSMAPSASAGDAEVNSAYADWRSRYVTSSGAGGNLRVRRTENSDDTVSEGIGYGMLLSAYLADRTTFDGLWRYAKSKADARGLMHWRIDAGGTVVGQNAATDADEDMALALIVADRKWGGYGADARTLIDRILTHEVESGSDVLKPGDVWGGSSVTNPSYFAPAYYKVFASYTGNSRWSLVAEASYRIIANVNGKTGAGTTGLQPDWVQASGDPASGMSYDYRYDAARLPWRLAHDAVWFGDSRATAQLVKLEQFWKSVGIANIRDGYTLSGGVLGQFHTATFVATAASGAIVSNDSAFRSAMWNEAVRVKNGNYYNDSLRALGLLFMAGKMVDPLSLPGSSGGGTGGASGTGGSGGGTASGGTGGSTSGCVTSTYEAEAMTASTGGPVSGGWNLWSNGSLSTSHGFVAGPTTTNVVARGQPASGTWPHMVLRVGGTIVGQTTVTASSWSSHPFSFSTAGGSQQIRVEFDNDLLTATEDRNLYVDKIIVSSGCGTGGTSGTGGSTGSGGSNSTGGSTSAGGSMSTGGSTSTGGSSATGGSGGITGGSGLEIRYRAGDTNATDGQIKPHYQIVNAGTQSVPLSELTVRYWYTVDGDKPQSHWFDWVALQGVSPTARFVRLASPRPGADYYLEVGFPSAAGSLASGASTGEIQSRFAKTDWSSYDERNDHSFDATKTSYATWSRMTLYRNGTRVWGVEP